MMGNVKKRLLRSKAKVAIVVTASVALAGCGAATPRAQASKTSTKVAKGSGVVTITYWNSGPSAGSGGASSGVPYLVSGFNKEYSGRYKVVYKTIPYTDETAVVNSALSGHTEPDLMEESLTFGSAYAQEGVVEPIDPILKMAGINPVTDFPPSLWDPSKVGGVHYMAPNNAISTLLFYNKALFRKAGLNPSKPPTTGQQLVADARALTNKSSGVWGYVEEPTGGGMNFSIQSIMDQYGAFEADAKTRKITFDTPGGVAAVQFFKNLIFKYHVSPANASPEEAHDLFVKGKNAMEITDSGDYAVYSPLLKQDLGVALVPKVGHNRDDFLGQNYWWVFKAPGMNTAVERGVALFMKYYYAHSLYLAQQGLFPTWLPAWRTSQF